MKVTQWWVAVVFAAGTVLLFAWLGRLAGVSPETLWTIGAAFAALTWVAVLVTVPWNLYFGARRVAIDQAASRERGLDLPAEQEVEARRIAHRMVRFAVGLHVGTAGVAAGAAFVSGRVVGYYLAGFFLLSTLLRPAAAYFAHLRHRIATLGREATHPRDDVLTLLARFDELAATVEDLRAQGTEKHLATTDAIRRTGDDIGHLRTRITADLTRLEDAQAADRAATRAADDDLRRTIEQMVRRVDATLDGVSDHQELLTGLRALVRMVRSE